jgi:hypothetical protein
MKKSKTRKVNKDAGNGQFVSNEEAKRRPKTTYSQTVPIGKR